VPGGIASVGMVEVVAAELAWKDEVAEMGTPAQLVQEYPAIGSATPRWAKVVFVGSLEPRVNVQMTMKGSPCPFRSSAGQKSLHQV
jgi:hypothetical protein